MWLYKADLYGRKYVGAIHTRFLPSATVASVLGPAILLNLRAKSEYQVQIMIMQLMQHVKAVEPDEGHWTVK